MSYKKEARDDKRDPDNLINLNIGSFEHSQDTESFRVAGDERGQNLLLHSQDNGHLDDSGEV